MIGNESIKRIYWGGPGYYASDPTDDVDVLFRVILDHEPAERNKGRSEWASLIASYYNMGLPIHFDSPPDGYDMVIT